MKRYCMALIGAGLFLGLSGQSVPRPAPPSDPRPLPPDPMARARDFETEYYSRFRVPGNVKRDTPADVAACLVSQVKGSAGRMIGGPETSDVQFTALARALSGKQNGCAPSGQMPLAYISGALAENLVKRERPTLSDRLAAGDVPSAAAFAPPPPGGVTMASLGRCLAAYSPGLSYRLLAQSADSAGEKAALVALYAATPECKVAAPPQGFSASEQRVAVATGLYLWTHRN